MRPKFRDLEEAEATWQSVEHWFELWENPRSTTPFSESCPLCDIGVRLREPFSISICTDCIINRTTGAGDCDNTPWKNAWREWDKVKQNQQNQQNQPRPAIEEQYAFLAGLAVEASREQEL